ncbi:MAG TPA: LysR family transcriptional regulator [Candidatus Enterenecus stercoripullorum]|nr:LysR family transcriptional regulator [Candidatus Enterenecus stercoripullorum]
MNTTQLECFLAVANYLNFSRAAQQLRITQPAVSHQINTLEDELGSKLFHRTSKSVQLTQAGHLFLQYASEILKLTGLSKARLKESRESLPQRFGIGCRNFLELRFMHGILERMRLEMPQIAPILRMIPFASLENLLEEEDIQVMFSLQEATPPKAVYRELVRCPIVCVCAPGHPLANASQLSLQQLAAGGRITVCPPPVYPPPLLAAQNQAIAGRGPNQMLFCDNLEIVFALVRAGYAFAVMADLPGGRLSGLRYIPLSEFKPLSYGAAYLSSKKSPVLRKFLAIAQSTVSGNEGTTCAP